MKRSEGFFITLEGGEGSGKSSLLTCLADYLKSHGYDVVTTREPGGTPLGEEIRNWLLSHRHSIKIGYQAELLLFLAARAQHIEELIKPSINLGKIVLCDRFNDSTIAYQGAARGLKTHDVRKLCEMVCGSIVPHLTLFLDVDPKIGLLRAKKVEKQESASGEFDRIESETLHFHEEVRKEFKKIASRESLRVCTIDASLSQADVLKKSLEVINKLVLLPAHKGLV